MEPSAVYALATGAGLDPEAAIIATAIAWAESGLDPQAIGDLDLEDGKWGPSCGLWQIRSLRADTGTGRPRDRERLLDPVFNAAAMATISGGTNWSPWSVWKNGRYLAHIDAVRAAVKETPVPTPVEIIRLAMADLEAEGFDVVFEPGWETRTVGGTFEPAGFVFHHTATSAAAKGDYPSLGIVRDGVNQGGGYFLPGPLSQFGGGRSGTIYVVAAGKANHAGGGGWNGISGNYSVWGCEFENNGIGEPWPARQVEAGIALAAALARHTGFGAESCCRHAEWSTAGKIDTATAPMNDGDWLRAQVAARLAGAAPSPVPVPKEDDMATPHILLTYGSGVALWHTSGKVVPLGSTKQVLDFLGRDPVVMDDLNADQIDKIVGKGTAEMLAAAPDLAHLLAQPVALSCAEAD
jgi:hypothetical protein